MTVTGFKDKNNIEIRVGDIMHFLDGDQPPSAPHIVRWHEESKRFAIFNLHGNFSQHLGLVHALGEVIGSERKEGAK